jgi:O-antigen ligase
VTQGYWGDKASMANWELMNRLSGSPSDVINPNGLAFVVITILPFMLLLYRENIVWKTLGMTVGPASIYVLYLTGSRSGLLGFFFILFIFVIKSKQKITLLIFITIISMYSYVNMDDNFKDRYSSIFSSETKNARTSQGRMNALLTDFKVGMHRPIFGHGLGTSWEANTNFGIESQISHCIYTETLQEIGIVGLVFFIVYIWSILKTQLNFISINNDNFLSRLGNIVFILSLMNIFFGFASYGLSSYEWYFFGGLSVMINTSLRKSENEEKYITDY